MKFVKNLKKFASNKYAQGAALMGAAGVASADVGADIAAAFTGANANVTTAAGGVIALVAVVTGIGLIISLLRK